MNTQENRNRVEKNSSNVVINHCRMTNEEMKKSHPLTGKARTGGRSSRNRHIHTIYERPYLAFPNEKGT